jgi:hypothetical protein
MVVLGTVVLGMVVLGPVGVPALYYTNYLKLAEFVGRICREDLKRSGNSDKSISVTVAPSYFYTVMFRYLVQRPHRSLASTRAASLVQLFFCSLDNCNQTYFDILEFR